MSVDFKKSGVATAASFGSTVAPLQEMKIKYLDDGSVWARIHYLNVSNSEEWYANEAEVMKCINKNNRYSRMGIVDMFKQSNGTYEFMLTYPLSFPNKYNRWTQTSSANVSHGNATGFTAIRQDLPRIGPLVKRPDMGNIIYSCDWTQNTNWHNPIGQMSKYELTTSTGLPYIIPTCADVQCTFIELWVRIDQLPETSICQIFDNSITATSFIEI